MYRTEYAKSYFKLPRRIIVNMFKKGSVESLTFSQLGLLVIYVGYADWDNRHSKSFATTGISNRCLAKLNGLNKDKIAMDKKILEIKRYIEVIKEKDNHEIIRIENPMNYYIDMEESAKEKRKLLPLASKKDKDPNELYKYAKEIFDV